MQPAPFILICDHRGEGAQEVAPKLAAQGFRVEVSVHLRGTLELLKDAEPDLILLDPLSSGASVEMDAIDRARRGDSLTPVLLIADGDRPLAAVMSPRTAERELWDLVHRSAPPEEYLLRIERLQRQVAHRVEVDDLRHRALHDDRTDLLRPQSFQTRLKEHFSAAQRHKLNLALLLIDLDKFGQINKQHDHTVGDSVIEKVADVIRNQKRTEDVAGRLGGDEFAVLLPHTAKVDAATVVQRLVERIKELSGPVAGAAGGVATSASIGFETFNGDDVDSLETLRNHAERALRAAKRSGGNCGVYYRSLDE
jgi:diguanylate cyclase (GGDEF)-like protein